MIFLILSILCCASVSIIMRISEGKIRSSRCMIFMNYIASIFLAVCFIGPANVFPRDAGLSSALSIGAFSGIFYIGSMMITQYNIRINGVVLPSIFGKVGGLSIPLILSVLLFSEEPSVFQCVGAVLALAAILMINYNKGSGGVHGSTTMLIVMLFVEGFAGSMVKFYRELGPASLSDNFLLYTFISALILSTILMLVRHERPCLQDVIFGILVGTANFFSVRFNLIALNRLPAVIVYPARSVGTLAVITLAGILFFRERLNRRHLAALPIIFAALLLLSL